MPKVLFVGLHRPDRSPSQRFRYEQYIEYLAENGWECHTSFLVPEKWDEKFYSSGHFLVKFNVLVSSILKRFKDVLKSTKYDIIFVQREALMIGSSFFERLFSKSSAKLLFDFDDAIWLSNVSTANEKLKWLKSPAKTSKIVGMADMVFAGNQYLADYALQFNHHVKVVPTTIDTEKHIKNGTLKRKSSTICIGWTGSTTTIKHFKDAVSFLKIIKNKYGDSVTFRVIGDAAYSNELLNIEGMAWNPETEIVDLLEIDIGIMPLPNDEWAKGKCGLKGLQYMALEIPTIMSPVGVNVDIINEGVNGFLAKNEKDWVDKISMLIENEKLRAAIGQKARETVVKHYSVDAQKSKYLNYFNQLMQE